MANSDMTSGLGTYKVVLVGDGGVGKTTFTKRLNTGNFELRYLPTIGVEVSKLSLKTTLGDITLGIWDCAGQEKFGGLRDGYYVKADAAIIMFDVGSATSFKNVKTWYMDVRRVCPDIPVFIVGAKSDSENRKIMPSQLSLNKGSSLAYRELSCKSSDSCFEVLEGVCDSIVKSKSLRIMGLTPDPERAIDPLLPLVDEDKEIMISLS